MKHDLLISLRKYRPREGHDPLENFITEAFCWILKSYDEFSVFFIDHLFKKMNIETKVIENSQWSTQANFGGFFPDMLCEFGDNAALVFENKAWAELHHNQINNYRTHATEKYNESYIILITATVRQHTQKPDLALCWSDVYKIIEEWLRKENNGDHFIFNDFLELIKSEGMAPLAPISQESIESYFAGGTELKSQVIDLSNKIKNCDWSKAKVALPSNKRQEPHLDKSEGRVGLYLLNDWNLNVFIGFLLLPEGNSYGYGITSVLGTKSPDFCVIISFFPESIRKNYPESETYKAFVNIIEKQIKELNQGWDFVIAPNKWHPIHIRKPMLELFKGTSTAEEQEARFMESAEQILNIIFKSDEFKKLNAECIQLAKEQ